MAAEFGWWPMSPWLSPSAAWFIFFNVLVGAIALMSSSRGQQQHDGRERRLARTASTVVLDSLRSISIFSFHSAGDYSVACSAPPPALHHVQEQYHTFQEQEPREEVAPQLPREPEVATVAEEESVVLPQSAPAAAAAAPTASPAASESQVEDDESSISLDEAYALARAKRQPPAAAAADKVPAKKEAAADAKARAVGCGRGAEEAEGKAEVNARAEQFIRQFREELKLERINSILNYTSALRRGAGAAPR
jgi:type IV secretory pathway VirB10-like protein